MGGAITFDRLLTLLSVILAIPGAALLFGDHVAVGALLITLAILLCLVWFYLNLPEFTVLRIEKVLTIHDKQGSKATLLRNQKARANHKGISEFWCRNISADGSINNIKINGEEPSKIIKEAGDSQVCMQFQPPLKAYDKFEMNLSYELSDSFLLARESMIHVVEADTKFLRMVVAFPQERPPKSSRLFQRFGGQVFKELESPHVSGLRVEAEIKKPLLGAEYCLQWEW